MIRADTSDELPQPGLRMMSAVCPDRSNVFPDFWRIPRVHHVGSDAIRYWLACNCSSICLGGNGARKFKLRAVSTFSMNILSMNNVNHHNAAASCSCQSNPPAKVSIMFFCFFISPSVMTIIQPQTRVFDPEGNETFVTRQSDLQIIF
jgi:hypothetical protein